MSASSRLAPSLEDGEKLVVTAERAELVNKRQVRRDMNRPLYNHRTKRYVRRGPPRWVTTHVGDTVVWYLGLTDRRLLRRGVVVGNHLIPALRVVPLDHLSRVSLREREGSRFDLSLQYRDGRSETIERAILQEDDGASAFEALQTRVAEQRLGAPDPAEVERRQQVVAAAEAEALRALTGLWVLQLVKKAGVAALILGVLSVPVSGLLTYMVSTMVMMSRRPDWTLPILAGVTTASIAFGTVAAAAGAIVAGMIQDRRLKAAAVLLDRAFAAAAEPLPEATPGAFEPDRLKWNGYREEDAAHAFTAAIFAESTGTHLSSTEVSRLGRWLREGRDDDGRPVQHIRVHFPDAVGAKRAGAPLLEHGVQVLYLGETGEYVPVGE